MRRRPVGQNLHREEPVDPRLPERLLTDVAQVNGLPDEIDWNATNAKLDALRRDSTEYLINAIED